MNAIPNYLLSRQKQKFYAGNQSEDRPKHRSSPNRLTLFHGSFYYDVSNCQLMLF